MYERDNRVKQVGVRGLVREGKSIYLPYILSCVSGSPKRT